MSDGPFLRAFYEMNTGDIAAIRIQPETAALVLNEETNTIPAGPATVPVSAKVSLNNREIGIKPRTVTIRFGAAVPNTQIVTGNTVTLPWFQADTWEALTPGATGTYRTVSVTLVGKSPERVR